MTRVIRADTIASVVPAELVDARAQARGIVERAERDAQQIRERAGAEARAELAAARVRDAQREQESVRALEAQAVEIALAAARRVIGDELRARPELVASLIAPHFERLRRARQITLRIHPDDRAALDARLAALRQGTAVAAAVRVETDPELSRGDCIVHSDVGSLDARVDTQLAALARALGTR